MSSSRSFWSLQIPIGLVFLHFFFLWSNKLWNQKVKTQQKVAASDSLHNQLHIAFCKEKWYFVTKIVLTYFEKKCSCEWEKLLKFEAKSQEFAKILRSLNNLFKQWKVRIIFGNRIFFWTCSWRCFPYLIKTCRES